MAAMTAFHPCGVVTLTTDFGLADPFVGVMKGRILSRFPAARIVDLSHEVPPQRPEVAGFWLPRCFEEFPRGTVHVAVVDPGVGTARAIVCLLTRGHLIIAPDNGLLAHCAARDPDAGATRVSQDRLERLGIERVSATFHGRDIFAPIAAEVAAGRCAPEALGPSVSLGAAGDDRAPIEAGVLAGHVVIVDHFGNLITNIEAQSLGGLETPQVHIAGRILPVRRTYTDVAPGELLALVNAFEVLEVARSQGSAAAALGVGRGTPVSVRSGGSEHLLGRSNRL